MKNKRSKWQSVAAFMMGIASVLSPATQAAPTVAQAAQSTNTKAVIQTQENKGQGIAINNGFDGDGGLSFHHEGMYQHSPMYFGEGTPNKPTGANKRQEKQSLNL